jgi:hypothetical protein
MTHPVPTPPALIIPGQNLSTSLQTGGPEPALLVIISNPAAAAQIALSAPGVDELIERLTATRAEMGPATSALVLPDSAGKLTSVRG